MAFRKKKTLLEQVQPRVESAVTTALDAVEDFYENTARPALADARDKAAPVIADARDKAVEAATPYVNEARDRASSKLHDARDTTESSLQDARAKAADLAAQAKKDAASRASDLAATAKGSAVAAKGTASARAADLAATAKETADARVAQLRGEKPKKGSKLRKIAVFAVLAGVVGFVAKKLQSGGQNDNWQSSYVPTPAPAPATPTKPTAVADDAGAAGPDEALADAAETPHDVTTPDDPAVVIDVDDNK